MLLLYMESPWDLEVGRVQMKLHNVSLSPISHAQIFVITVRKEGKFYGEDTAKFPFPDLHFLGK